MPWLGGDFAAGAARGRAGGLESGGPRSLAPEPWAPLALCHQGKPRAAWPVLFVLCGSFWAAGRMSHGWLPVAGEVAGCHQLRSRAASSSL